MANLIDVNTWPHRLFTGFCPRCGSARQHADPNGEPSDVDNTAGYLCKECMDETWRKAESYGGDWVDIQARAWEYQKEWRALDPNRLKPTLTEEVN